ncbi:ATP-dependent nuclease [Amycolatopsis sp. NBC_01480]|uniref:ATP-dependent nuclease n=1 Tax=Amycolatopsis sp. NBC_01480 TaxID=2903562 RepID=UPI002E2CD440|nr:AAA family ATPase [Amycolatopsis sp. NBC_01480]
MWYVDTFEAKSIGEVKFGRFGMRSGSPDIPPRFQLLGGEFFSLGQDAVFYERIRNLGDDVRVTILGALRDTAFDESIFNACRNELVTQESLLRSVDARTVETQFRRIAHGGRTLERIFFAYRGPGVFGDNRAPLIDVEVLPDSSPPTNVHAIIGSNGAGKTTLLRDIATAVLEPRAILPDSRGQIVDEQGNSIKPFVNLISVSFSSFDEAQFVESSRSITHRHVSIYRQAEDGSQTYVPKSAQHLSEEFAEAAAGLTPRQLDRWKDVLTVAATDPILEEALAPILNSVAGARVGQGDMLPIFSSLSSGHKIVLLALTHLAKLVAERTLILADEPETHLHPPLLSSFMRALSGLLVEQNGVALVATHSPVVLQEMPRSCVWKLRRSGQSIKAARLAIETFGENVGVLTREVFGLEITRSGFHRMLEDSVGEGMNYAEILQKFQGQLGGEAKSLIRALLAERMMGD